MTIMATSLLIDTFMPTCDVAIAEHVIVRRDPATTFRAVRELDFMSIHTPVLDLAMWARGVPARLTGRAVEPPPRLVLSEGDALPGWVLLGETAGHEIAFGAVGKFWQSSIEWRDVEADEFAAFAEPGWGKIAADLSVVPYGERAALLTYECRTKTFDERPEQMFARYWKLIGPFVGHILRATVHTIRENAERQQLT